MTRLATYKNWVVDQDKEQVIWLTLDEPDDGANVLSLEVLDELVTILADFESTPPKGLIILSGKSSGFIAGADIKEFTKLENEQQAMDLIVHGQRIMDRVEALPFPTVAMICGFCLGGGLELALACDHRVASDDPKTKLGLPEVMLGIHPGFGGTVRMTRLLGPMASMDMMLTGRSVSAKAAEKMGLVDFAVPERHVKKAAKKIVVEGIHGKQAGFMQRVMNNKLPRSLIAGRMEKRVSKRAPADHYPAPHALIELWRDHFDDKKDMLTHEAESVARLITTPTSKNLVRVFFLQDRLKSLGNGRKLTGANVHVVGAGVMGGDIASWLAMNGFKVSLQDTEPRRIAAAIKRAHGLFKTKLNKPKAIQPAMDRLTPDMDGVGVHMADLVIEAIFENLDAKKALYGELEAKMKPEAILATNTSSIPLEELAVGMERPERFVGMHFFNPVAKMKLVEVVTWDGASKEAVSLAASFVKSMDRLPLMVKSSPGFLVNRVLMPYLLEAVAMVEEGISIEAIDRAATRYGMPMGPITLADSVGLDICLYVGEIMERTLNVHTPEILKSMVDRGALGRKTGLGFYEYKNGKPIKTQTASEGPDGQELADRLISRLLNESVACLREGVVEDADLLDAGVIFGTGFAPFRGGPMHYAKETGIETLMEKFRLLKEKYGPRFAPDAGWDDQ